MAEKEKLQKAFASSGDDLCGNSSRMDVLDRYSGYSARPSSDGGARREADMPPLT